jgi:predicted hydrocarbon binding protein
MTEARIGRVVVAALHEALAHQVPLRLDFYESYLRPTGMRAGRIGVASFTAALSFLRREPGAYESVVRQAGALAAQWTYDEARGLGRAMWERLPDRVRERRALRLASRLVEGTLRDTHARIDGARDARHLLITGSPFCDLRQPSQVPMCGFYVAALERFLELLEVQSPVVVAECQAMGHAHCRYDVGPGGSATVEDAARAERMLT